MDYERISTYLHSLESDHIELINDIEAYATEHTIPIARRETVSFLQTMVFSKNPKRILEVGTAVAYSTLIMIISANEAGRLYACADDREDIKLDTDATSKLKNENQVLPHIVSIERNKTNYKLAKANVEKAVKLGLIEDGQVELIYGDATDVLAGLDDEFDFVFMDAAKGQYICWLPDVLRLLKPYGILISDNIFQDETLLESKFSVERRERTIHKRMREYLFELKHNPDLMTSLLPLGDGVAMSVKKEPWKKLHGKS